jgi:hypothetical protein
MFVSIKTLLVEREIDSQRFNPDFLKAVFEIKLLFGGPLAVIDIRSAVCNAVIW